MTEKASFTITCNGHTGTLADHRFDEQTQTGRITTDAIQFNINQPGPASVVHLDQNVHGSYVIEIDRKHIFVNGSLRWEVVACDTEIKREDARYDHQWSPDKVARVDIDANPIGRAVWKIVPLFPHKATIAIRFFAEYHLASRQVQP